MLIVGASCPPVDRGDQAQRFLALRLVPGARALKPNSVWIGRQHKLFALGHAASVSLQSRSFPRNVSVPFSNFALSTPHAGGAPFQEGR